MQPTENNSTPTVSYLIEYSHGTCELWVKRTEDRQTTIYEAVKLEPVSGQGAFEPETATITEAIALEEWMADHFEVFTEGRTSAG